MITDLLKSNKRAHKFYEKLGAKIVLKALEEPIRQIAKNAGLEGAIILDKIKASDIGIGFNAATEEYVDMKKTGIVDPTKVTRSALLNAASVASMVLTTESLIADKPEDAAAANAAAAAAAADAAGIQLVFGAAVQFIAKHPAGVLAAIDFHMMAFVGFVLRSFGIRCCVFKFTHKHCVLPPFHCF